LEQRDSVEVASHVDVLSAQVRDALSIAQGLRSDLGWLDVFNGMEPSPANAGAFADLFRRRFGRIDDLEPFPQLAQVLATMGVLLLFSRDPTVERVSAMVEGHAIVLIGPRTFKPRMLFTVAHELGHLVAHHDRQAKGYALLDKEADWSRSPRRTEEKFADAFASALLLPQHGVLSALKVVREHLGIAQKPLGAAENLANRASSLQRRRNSRLEFAPIRFRDLLTSGSGLHRRSQGSLRPNSPPIVDSHPVRYQR
jgi:Zn-dependent peptidase ImmA (M78 family)